MCVKQLQVDTNCRIKYFSKEYIFFVFLRFDSNKHKQEKESEPQKLRANNQEQQRIASCDNNWLLEK